MRAGFRDQESRVARRRVAIGTIREASSHFKRLKVEVEVSAGVFDLFDRSAA